MADAGAARRLVDAGRAEEAARDGIVAGEADQPLVPGGEEAGGRLAREARSAVSLDQPALNFSRIQLVTSSSSGASARRMVTPAAFSRASSCGSGESSDRLTR